MSLPPISRGTSFTELEEADITVRRHFDARRNTAPSLKQAVRPVRYAARSLQLNILQDQSLKFEARVVEARVNDNERLFNQLASQWESETGMLSVLSQKVLHPAYQRIIGMGEKAIPLLLKELEREPNHWFWALRAITGVNPVKPENRGRIKRMAQDWLDWGRDHGYCR